MYGEILVEPNLFVITYVVFRLKKERKEVSLNVNLR